MTGTLDSWHSTYKNSILSSKNGKIRKLLLLVKLSDHSEYEGG